MANLPYRDIPPPPNAYSAGKALGRIVDGLGFRYHWATEGLTQKELDYRPDRHGRTGYDTVSHIYNIVTMVNNVFTGERFPLPETDAGLPLDELRRHTLEKVQRISDRLKGMSDDDLQRLTIGFSYGERDLDFPFWNAINGPIADAIYHVGQIVSLRRAAGNPIDPGVDVFRGRRRLE